MLQFADGATRLGGRTGFYFASSLFDPDAAAYFAAAGITDSAQMAAVNNLVLALKAESLWLGINALYPFVGGNATAHSYNLINPAVHQITWSVGGVTHNANGITGDGSTGYGDCNISPDHTGENCGLSAYVRTLPTGDNKNPVGVQNAADNNYYFLHCNVAFGQYYTRMGQTELAVVGSAPTAGMISGNRTSSSALRLDKNGASVATNSNGIVESLFTDDYYVLARNRGGTAEGLFDGTLALLAFHQGFTEAESLALYNAVQTFQTALGRNV